MYDDPATHARNLNPAPPSITGVLHNLTHLTTADVRRNPGLRSILTWICSAGWLARSGDSAVLPSAPTCCFRWPRHFFPSLHLAELGEQIRKVYKTLHAYSHLKIVIHEITSLQSDSNWPPYVRALITQCYSWFAKAMIRAHDIRARSRR